MSLKLDLITTTAEAKGISLRRLSTEVGMSAAGLKKALEKETLRLNETLVLCAFLDLDVQDVLGLPQKKESKAYIEDRIGDLELTAEGHESVLANIDIQMSNIKSQLTEIQAKISNLQKAK